MNWLHRQILKHRAWKSYKYWLKRFHEANKASFGFSRDMAEIDYCRKRAMHAWRRYGKLR